MTSPFSYNYTHLLPHEQIGLHQDSSWELSYVIKGAGTRLIGDTTEPFQSGEVILIPPDIPHCWHFVDWETDKRGRIANITVNFMPDFLANLERTFSILGENIGRLRHRVDAVKFTRRRAAGIIRLLESMRDLSAEHRIAPMIELLLAISETDDEVIVGKHRQKNREQERLDRVRVFVICNAQREITLEAISRHVGMNRTAFCSFFKRATGKTFVRYLNEYRVELACRALEQREMSIADVCYHAGFNNVPYFNRIFKRLKGVSPTSYVSKKLYQG